MKVVRGWRARSRLTWWLLAAVPVGFLALFLVWPLAAVVSRGFSGEWATSGVLTWVRLGRVGGTTLSLALLGTMGSVALGVPSAYVMYRLRWLGVRTVRAIAAIPFVLPTMVVAAAFSALTGRDGLLAGVGLDHSVWVVVAALVFYNVAVVARTVGSAWAGFDPATGLAARTLGASRWRAFWHVTLPALTPSIAASAALVFVFCASSFGVVLVLGVSRISTVETEIYRQVNQFLDLRAASVLALLQLTIVGAALFVADSLRARRERSLKSRRVAGDRAATLRDLPIIVVVLSALALLMGGPLGTLIERSLRTSDGYSWRNYAALASVPANGALPEPVLHAATRSLLMAAVATILASGIGLLIAYLATQRTRQGRFLVALASLPLGASAVMVGLGLLLTLNRNMIGFDLRGSWWLLPIGQAMVALPFVARALLPAARSIDNGLRSAAASLGAGPFAVWRHVDWPLLKRPFGVAIGFAAAMALGEFGATAFLARPDSPTLPVAIFRLLSRPGEASVGMAFAASVLLAVVTGGIMAVAERLRPDVEAGL